MSTIPHRVNVKGEASDDYAATSASDVRTRDVVKARAVMEPERLTGARTDVIMNEAAPTQSASSSENPPAISAGSVMEPIMTDMQDSPNARV